MAPVIFLSLGSDPEVAGPKKMDEGSKPDCQPTDLQQRHPLRRGRLISPSHDIPCLFWGYFPGKYLVTPGCCKASDEGSGRTLGGQIAQVPGKLGEGTWRQHRPFPRCYR